MLADGAKEAGPVGCSYIYWLKLYIKIIIFQVEYLGAYVHVFFLTFGDVLLSCYYDTTTFAANRWPLTHRYD